MAEHLARDTGLRPGDITTDIAEPRSNAVAEHLAADTGVDETEVTDDGEDLVNAVVGRFPID